jgi:hypothetical protein
LVAKLGIPLKCTPGLEAIGLMMSRHRRKSTFCTYTHELG